MRESFPDKAYRLVNSRRVILLENEPGHVTAAVIGDQDTYTVRFRPHGAFCECEWFRGQGHESPCGHILATRLAMDEPESQLPVKRLADALRSQLPAKKPAVAMADSEAGLHRLFNFSDA